MPPTGTGAARAKAAPDLNNKASGKGYVITDGKYEMFLTPLGNIPKDTVDSWVNLLRAGFRNATTHK
jgi:hypothetical protein